MNTELAGLVKNIDKLIAENARVAQDQDEYEGKYTELETAYDEKKAEAATLQEQIENAKASHEILGEFIEGLEKTDDDVAEFSERLWGSLAEDITINSDSTAVVRYKGELRITVSH